MRWQEPNQRHHHGNCHAAWFLGHRSQLGSFVNLTKLLKAFVSKCRGRTLMWPVTMSKMKRLLQHNCSNHTGHALQLRSKDYMRFEQDKLQATMVENQIWEEEKKNVSHIIGHLNSATMPILSNWSLFYHFHISQPVSCMRSLYACIALVVS